jgi:hypothetical protein
VLNVICRRFVHNVTIKPANRIRRFDVFAEYRKQEEQDHGMPADRSKGYGLSVAKVVAARKFGHLKDREPPSQAEARARRRRKWRVLSGEPQTDQLFDRQIVDRMGTDFYKKVFAPAVRHEREAGHSYESMRDRIRRRWKPAPH